MSTAPPEEDPSFTLTCPYCRKSFLASEKPPEANPGEVPLDVTRDAPADQPFPVLRHPMTPPVFSDFEMMRRHNQPRREGRHRKLHQSVTAKLFRAPR